MAALKNQQQLEIHIFNRFGKLLQVLNSKK
ncbi:hypothetical protein KW502_14390 [Mesonia sp. JHPTF-M18]|uniref:Uncharacterized protein n=1 Tax=Mesonia aestuariivivens TaxID=2796128 RepID=A0ABS6W5I7_9FLAO|nr:hypothetical protein [Mesonia aestuariivivens]